MRFSTNKPADEVQQPAPPVMLRKNTNAPAFRPQILRSVRMHPLVAGVVAGVVLVGLVGYALKAKPVYQAESVIYLEPTPPKLLADGTTTGFDSARYDAFVGEQTGLMQRPDVLQAALTQAGVANPKAAVGGLLANLKVTRIPNSYQVALDVKDTDPERAATLANAIADAYLKAVHRENSSAADQRAQLLAEERQRIASELQAARAEQAALGASIGVANPSGDGGNPYDAELAGIRMQLIDARAAHEAAAAQLSSLSGVGPSANGLVAVADEAIAGDAGLSSMKAMISQRKASLNSQMAGMTPSNPIYKVDQDELSDLDKTLNATTTDLRNKAEQRVQQKLRTDLQRTGDVEARLNGELARQIAHATSAAPKLQRASEVTGDIVRLNTREALVDDSLRALRMEQDGPGQVRIQLPAAVPTTPEPSRVKLLLLAALPLALLLGGFAAVLMRKQDQRIYEAMDINEVLGFPTLAVLPARNDVSDRVFEEYVLRLAAGIESAYRTGGARTFLLTAVSLTTDIVPYTSALTRKFGEIGVNAVVATASDMLSGDEAEGGVDSEMVSRSVMLREGFVAANMARLKTGHGLVLIESEALLNDGQTEYVARCADATILLVESGVTTRHELYCAAELLERMQVTGIGAVLSELQLRFADAGFRAAIASLDRRLSTQARPARMAERQPVVAEAGVPEVHMPEVAASPEVAVAHEAVLAEQPPFVPEPVPEPVPDPVHHPETVVSAEPLVAETPASEPPIETPKTEAWELPAVAAAMAVSAESQAIAEEKVAPVRRAAAVSGPVLVPAEMMAPAQDWENFEEEPVIAVANGTMHEKMAPKLSARREVSGSIGDGAMTRKTSWLGRLLGRDEGPKFSIIPDDDEDDETPDEAPRVATRAQKAEQTTTQEYDLPLASRLEQISRQRPVAPPMPPQILQPGSTRNSRLQIVPDHAFEPVPETGLYEAAGFEPVYEEVAEPVAAVAETPVVETPKVEEPVRRLARPMSFQELQQKLEAAPVHEFVEPEAAVEENAELPETALEHVDIPEIYEPDALEAASVVEAPAPVVETVAEEQAAIEERLEPEHIDPVHVEAEHAAPEHIEPQQSEPEPLAPEHFEPEHVEPIRVEPVHVEPVHVEPMQVEAIHAEPIRDEPVYVEAAQLEPAHVQPVVAEPVYQWQAPVPQPQAPVQPPLAPVQAPLTESSQFDIEPVYEEASRHLQGGRWDPIPPLRSTGNGWRDRPSPVPSSNYQAGYDAPDPQRRRWTGTDQEITRWTSDLSANQPAGVATQTEPLPEPILTRQWGLLSKFQQARASSGSRAATNDDERDPNGNGRR